MSTKPNCPVCERAVNPEFAVEVGKVLLHQACFRKGVYEPATAWTVRNA